MSVGIAVRAWTNRGEPHAMTFDEAVVVLKGPRQNTLQSYIDHGTAAVVYYAHYTMNRDRSQRLTIDGPDRHRLTRDAPPSVSAERTLRHENRNESSGLVGPRRIMRLDGPASAYQILTTADGETWLCLSSSISGQHDPGAGSAGVGIAPRPLVTDTMKREVQRDARWSRTTLRSINEANRAFWAKEQHHG
jgi:hypothetical protein